jgi:hypothetical protein
MCVYLVPPISVPSTYNDLIVMPILNREFKRKASFLLYILYKTSFTDKVAFSYRFYRTLIYDKT